MVVQAFDGRVFEVHALPVGPGGGVCPVREPLAGVGQPLAASLSSIRPGLTAHEGPQPAACPCQSYGAFEVPVGCGEVGVVLECGGNVEYGVCVEHAGKARVEQFAGCCGVADGEGDLAEAEHDQRNESLEAHLPVAGQAVLEKAACLVVVVVDGGEHPEVVQGRSGDELVSCRGCQGEGFEQHRTGVIGAVAQPGGETCC